MVFSVNHQLGTPMQIWVDADACPNVIKAILFRAAERVPITLTMVANRPVPRPGSPNIRSILVPDGWDAADDYIKAQVQQGDLVITGDIPLAADIITRGGYALDPRGNFYTQDNVRERLAIRNFMDELRGSGVDTGGPAPLNQSDRQAFANQLDRFLARHAKT
jgi:uncharacterized protein YaiI (UPF0178 family)